MARGCRLLLYALLPRFFSAVTLPCNGCILNTGLNAAGAVLGSGATDANWQFAGPGSSRFASAYTFGAATTSGWAAVTTPAYAFPDAGGLNGIPIQGSVNSYAMYQQWFTSTRPIARVEVTWATDDWCMLFLNGALVYTDTCPYNGPEISAHPTRSGGQPDHPDRGGV